jgi:hypothetical protein
MSMIGEDGFTYYDCTECGGRKIAALFLPDNIATGDLRCRVCIGEIACRSSHGPRPWQKVQPNQRMRPIDRSFARTIPQVVKR